MPVALDSKPPTPGAPSWYIRICNEQNKKRMSFRPQECESRNLLKQQVLFCVGSFSNVVDSSTPRSCGRNDKGETFLRIRPLFMQHFAPPRRPHQSRPRGEPASPEGSSCSVSAGLRLNLTEIYPEGSPERHTCRSLRFGWWVLPFNHTGCIRNVAWR